MRTFRYFLWAAIPMLAFAFLAGCDNPAVEEPDPTPPIEDPDPDPKPDNSLNEISLLEAFTEQFNDGRAMTDLRIRNSGKWEVDFDDERTREFLDTDVAVFACSVLDWPALTIKSGGWYINGEDTGIHYNVSPEEVGIVAVIYDGEGLYVRLSTGKILFFHQDKVLDIGCFRFEKGLNPSLDDDVVCTVGEGVISANFGYKTAAELIVTVGYRGDNMVYKTKELQSSVTAIKPSETGSVQIERTVGDDMAFTLGFTVATNYIPKLYITVNGATIPAPYDKTRKIYPDPIPGTMRVEDPDLRYASTVSETMNIEIRGRGSSTWDRPKKPYKIKLEEKKELLGMSNSKHWVLMANYIDKSQFRNILAAELSKMMGLAWTADWRPVEVYVDNVYYGLYMLTEHVRAEEGRVELDLVLPGATGGDAITGGYFIEADNRPIERNRSVGIWTSKGLPVVIDAPESPTAAQRAYIENYIQSAENLIYASTKNYDAISAAIDIDSFIKYFIIHELAKDQDGGFSLSTYMWKPYMGKLGIPCVWDFDIAFGNHSNDNANYIGWNIRNARWFTELFKIQAFADRVKVLWQQYVPQMLPLVAVIQGYADDLNSIGAIAHNTERCNLLCNQVNPNDSNRGDYYVTKVWPDATPQGSFEGELAYLLSWYTNRVNWMNTQIMAGNHKK